MIDAGNAKARKKKDEEGIVADDGAATAVEKKPKRVKAPEVPEVKEIKPLDIVKSVGINEAVKQLKIDGTTIVRTKEDARRVIEILRTVPDRIHAWDTETIHIDAKE